VRILAAGAALRRPSAGVAFSQTGVIVHYNTGSAPAEPASETAMNKPNRYQDTMRMITIIAVACLTLASMMA
jgi:hypothetical protein